MTPLTENFTVTELLPEKTPWAATEAEAVQVLWIVIRPGYLIALFFAGWAANVFVFKRVGVNYRNVLGLHEEELASPMCFLTLSFCIVAVLGAVRSVAQVQGPTPALLCMCLVGYLGSLLSLYVWLPAPLDRLVRWRVPLGRALLRCVIPDTKKGTPFIEVLVADGLTSTAKVFFDLVLGSCVALQSVDVSIDFSDQQQFSSLPFLRQGLLRPKSRLGDALAQCNRSPLPFFAWASPFIIRAVQCCFASKYAPDKLTADLQKVNLMKYCTSFPVVLFAYLFANASEYGEDNSFARQDYEFLWAVAAVVNSTFSFMWDMTMDWGLLQPGPVKSGQFGLRPVLLFRGFIGFYYLAIILNLVGRTLWSLRWSPDAALVFGGLFLTSFQQAAEVSRRCLWNVLRVEWECVKKGVYHTPKGHVDIEI